MGNAPKHFKCHPSDRFFPPEWKDVYFRRFSKSDGNHLNTYDCPLCGKAFTYKEIDQLQGDHIWPYSLFGATSWENYQLICGNCNSRKGNFLDKDLRDILGSGPLMDVLGDFFKKMLQRGEIADNKIIKQFLVMSGHEVEP